VPVTNLPVARYSRLASYGLITNETTLNENPELVQNMIDAFLEGLAHTIDNAPDVLSGCSQEYQNPGSRKS
jgi:ABC-type nitrate/sulfonate/bicarbonate transport system substrate-binding protein